MKWMIYKPAALFILAMLAVVITYGQPHDTVIVYFQLDNTGLSDQATHHLDSMEARGIISRDHKIMVLGYCDNLGSNDYNAALSKARAKSVMDYLLVNGYERNNVTLCMGKGKARGKDSKENTANPFDRRVDVIIEKEPDTPAAQKFAYYMQNRQANETLPLNEIHFYRGSLRLTPESIPQLKVLYNFLELNKTYTIQLEGHVCCLGPYSGFDEPYDSSTLSTLRAGSIYDSLVSYGIDKARLKYIGLGNNNPIADPEITEEEMELNRRVDVRILSK